jgi:hypothetical protein
MVPLRYEVRPKSRSVNLRLSEELLSAVKVRASEDGIAYQRFIRMTLEQAFMRGRKRAPTPDLAPERIIAIGATARPRG